MCDIDLKELIDILSEGDKTGVFLSLRSNNNGKREPRMSIRAETTIRGQTWAGERYITSAEIERARNPAIPLKYAVDDLISQINKARKT
jgi:hypothetical protein